MRPGTRQLLIEHTKLALKDIGFTADDIEKAARIATQNPYANPAEVTYEGVVALLEDACEGVRPQ